MLIEGQKKKKNRVIDQIREGGREAYRQAGWTDGRVTV